MAIVEDEVRNESEEDNDIEVVVEEDDAEQDSEVSDDDDDEEALEKKVSDLELRIANDPYSYNEHIELIEALWRLSELDRWRAAFDRLQNLSLLQAEHWLLRLQTEVTLGHSSNSREQIIALFEQATLDCYSIPILSEWCTWCTCFSDNTEMVRAQLDEVLRRAGPDPLSGKIFWDAKFEFEQAQLEAMNESDPGYKEQKGRVIYCLEEVVSRPLLRSVEALPQFQEMASAIHGDEYVEKVKRQHDRSVEFVEALTPYEDKLLTAETAEEKYKIYQDYIDTVKAFSEDDKFAECDCNGILRVLYDRATHECSGHALHTELLRQFADYTLRSASRSTCSRVIKACCRRAPRCVAFCVLRMQCEEKYGATLEEIKSIFESALSRGTDSYKDAESLWLAYLEFIRRHTAFDNEADVERLRKTFRLAWDSLAEAWGVEANDCEIPLFWARLEYKLMKDSKQGKEIFEELFKYGENKTMAKYWEQLIQLELIRQPPLSENKVRDLFRRALKFVQDYPPSVVRVWTDYERDYGQLSQLRECQEACEAKLKEWRENYQTMKEKMTGKKQKGKTDNKQMNNKKDKTQSQKFEKKTQNKGKRKSDESQEGSQVKRKKDIVDVEMVDKNSSSGLKRTHDGSDKTEASGSKRPKTDSASSGPVQEGREACTLFVSNLEFKVDEQKLRDKLSEYGDIVSMRVRAGVKAFGGSICYCQYKTPESVDEAIKHDRTPIEGRPMFLSRYSSNKSSKTFKYATTTEKNKLFVKNLPFASCSKDALAEIFDKYGNLKDVRIVTYKDGKPKGFAYIEFEDESSASNALDKTNGLLVGDRKIEVAISAPPSREDGATPALGQSKREQSGGMRRTQLSSFIPSVLQRATTSKAANGNHSNGDDNKPMSNSDFRNMLLKK